MKFNVNGHQTLTSCSLFIVEDQSIWSYQSKIFFFHTLHDLLQDVRDSGIFPAIDVNMNRQIEMMTRLSSIERDISTDYAQSLLNTLKDLDGD